MPGPTSDAVSGSRSSSSPPTRPGPSTSATAGGRPTATPSPACSTVAATRSGVSTTSMTPAVRSAASARASWPDGRARRCPMVATAPASSRAWRPPTTAPTTWSPPVAGRPSAPSATSSCRWPRSTSTSMSGTARPRSRRAMRSTRRSALLRERGLVFEEEGATWLRTGEFGDPRETRVLRRSDGDWTYLAGDIAYHRNKFLLRGFDRVIDVWGADHQGQVASLKAGVAALGIDPGRLEVRLGQMISLASGRDVEADRQCHRPRRSRRRHRRRRHATAQPGQLDRPGHHGGPRPVADRVQGQPRLLRADGLCPHRRHRAGGGQARGDPASARPRSTFPCSWTNASSRSCAACPSSQRCWRRRASSGLPTRSPPGCASWRTASTASTTTARSSIPTSLVDLTQARLWLVEAARIGFAVGLGLLGVAAPETM